MRNTDCENEKNRANLHDLLIFMYKSKKILRGVVET